MYGVGGGNSCFCEFVSGFVDWYAFMTWDLDEDGEACEIGCQGILLCARWESRPSSSREPGGGRLSLLHTSGSVQSRVF